jgi:hypothetical protein
MFYDVGQGQGWQRNIVMNRSPHLPAGVRQWFGDSRGHWDGNTLIINVTNFSPKTDFQGARENLHLVERWTRTGPDSLAYEVTIEDPAVWTRPWPARQAEHAFTEGRGPDPATVDNVTTLVDLDTSVVREPQEIVRCVYVSAWSRSAGGQRFSYALRLICESW